MSAAYEFQHRVEFLPEDAERILRQVPAAAGVFALRGADDRAEPYLTRAADVRRRLKRLLAPPELRNEDGQPVLSRRLNLRDKVRFIEWTRTGSEFESVLVLYCATRAVFGPEAARKRLRLHAPYFLRITQTNPYPRVYATNKLSRRALHEFLGPYPSRAAAERHCDAVLELFKLRRCYEDLAPYPEHPGCVYGEMGKCLRPCQQACTDADYRAEAERVYAFFATRGESMLAQLAAERDAASEAMDFERAAALHAQWEKARAAANLADELVRPAPDLRALIIQKAPPLDAPELNPDSPQTVSSRPEPAPYADLASSLSLAASTDVSSRPERSEVERPAVGPATDLSSRPESALRADAAGSLSVAPSTDVSSRPERSEEERPAVGLATDLSSLPEAALPANAAERPASPPVPQLAPLSPELPSLDAALFLFERGRIVGPARLSTLGVRAVREQTAVGSSLFAQPLMLAAIPLDEPPVPHVNPVSSRPEAQRSDAEVERPAAPSAAVTLSPEDRARAVVASLHDRAEAAGDPEIAERADFLSLFRRWYYRPEKQRTGEAFLPGVDDSWPIRRILNASARAVLGPPAEVAPVDREAAKDLKTRTLHEGREGVERIVPVLPKRGRRGKAVTPAQVQDSADQQPR